jgi:hypothetical protein
MMIGDVPACTSLQRDSAIGCMNLFFQGILVKTRFLARLTFHFLEYLYRRASRRVLGIVNNE